MPAATIKPSDLKPGHPAVTKSGRWTAQARRVLNRPILRSRYRTGDDEFRKNPIRNTPLLNQMADYLEVFPEAWNQTVWGAPKEKTPCGTAFCIAGTAVHETNWKPTYSDTAWFDEITDRWMPGDNWEEITRGNDAVVLVNVAAAIELGLTKAESNYLFDAEWRPKKGQSVSEVLRLIGQGAQIETLGLGDEAYAEDIEIEYEDGHKIRVSGVKP